MLLMAVFSACLPDTIRKEHSFSQVLSTAPCVCFSGSQFIRVLQGFDLWQWVSQDRWCVGHGLQEPREPIGLVCLWHSHGMKKEGFSYVRVCVCGLQGYHAPWLLV